jgi:hypothetical protein
MTLEDYLDEYDKNKQEARNRTSQKYQAETRMLEAFIDNWYKLIPKDNLFDEAVDSLSGIMLLNSWRLSKTITCEILSGEYFEAIRNLRFIFEGTAHAILLEEVVGSLPEEDQIALTPLPVKAIMLQTWEECKRKKVTEASSETREIEAIVLEALSNRTALVSFNEAPKLVHPLTKMLSDKRIYASTTRMLELSGDTLQLPIEDVQALKQLWRDLSDYQHFSYPYVETIIRHPEICFKEKLDDTLFKRSLNFYQKVMDYFYATLAWRFKDLETKVKEICENWENQFKTKFSLTLEVLNNGLINNRRKLEPVKK